MGRTILDDLKEANSQTRAEASGEVTPELPGGSAPVVDEETPAESSVEELAAAASTDEEDEIRIGERTFKTQKEALRYAEQMESEKLTTEAYNMGIREALLQSAPKEEVVPPPPEFSDEEFFTDPAAALVKAKNKAKEEAKSELRSEFAAEAKAAKQWDTFLTKYPDLDQQDAQRILAQNWDTIGKMNDEAKAMEVLAQKTRAEYQRIADRLKPRTELPKRSGQVVSPSSNHGGGVTPPPKQEKVLTMSEQMRTMRRR